LDREEIIINVNQKKCELLDMSINKYATNITPFCAFNLVSKEGA
jgi:hypothetical protein